jgi:hypothetical protein
VSLINNASDNRITKLGRHVIKQGPKRPLDTPKKMIERREREGERER